MGLALFCFSVTIDAVAAHEFVIIDLVAVKVRAVDAGEFDLAADRDTTAAAHAGAVDHDGVQRDDGLDAEGLGGLGDEFHHRDRADGEHFVIVDAGLEQLLQLDGNKAVLAVGAVVGHEIQMVAGLLELVFENDDVLVAEADDDVGLDTRLFKGLCRRICDRAADAAADDADALLAFHVRRLAERTDKVLDIVALVQTAEHLGGQADLLEDDRDRALFAVIAGDGQRHALRLLIDTENDELAGLRLAGDERSLDLHVGDCGVQFLFAHDFVHSCSSLQIISNILACSDNPTFLVYHRHGSFVNQKIDKKIPIHSMF